jgi:hypothetical protein
MIDFELTTTQERVKEFAHQFAKNNHFSVEQCRRYGIHAQIARDPAQHCDVNSA